MENKNRYYNLLKEDNGQQNEIDLGEKVGLNEEETREIVSQLLSEHKIEYKENKACNYRVVKKLKKMGM
ncbi:hypothetical protein MUK70_03565 [Dyadobacter chenwenxiniae]|uniref:Uncharacterized protein n=1 Tax=Dyadobacter chenwenxiniae TaxID=2906456 RepID=A0A9X1PUG1_9BACT|nr:hypothetical protein [Dyadobacter chenwenxiniae]MCF0065823.1 hypothetical protein [Dyadobacter chenwenxiniae]UON84070.1 hypothetical protein MUK70_03565 [Dyadobacter chenwenxiniae]